MDTRSKRINKGSIAQFARFLAVILTNPLAALFFCECIQAGNGVTVILFFSMLLVCLFFTVWMFVCTGRTADPDAIELGELGKLPTEALIGAAIAAFLAAVLLASEIFGYNTVALVFLGTAGGGAILLLLLALARKWKAGCIVEDMVLKQAWRYLGKGIAFVFRALRNLLTGHDILDVRYPAGRAWMYRILWVCGAMAGLVLLSFLIMTNQLFGVGESYWFGPGRYTAFAIFAICVVALGAWYLVWCAARDAKAFDRVLKQIDAAAKGGDAPVCVPAGSGLYTASRDVAAIGTNLRESVEAQVKSERMKVDLITNVSHDLKTPLTSIIGYIDLLEKQEGLSDEARDYVRILQQKSTRLATTVADLFTLAKATSGNETLHIEPLDLVMAVRQTLGDLLDSIRAAGIPIKASMPESALVRADSAKLYRVLQNILDNALRYSLTGTRIYLDVTPGDIATRLTLLNTASYEMTFAPDEILQRFVRGDENRTTEGSGLGLSIAQTFMQNFGGDLTVEIRGDAFILTLIFPNGAEEHARAKEITMRVYGAENEEEPEELPEECPSEPATEAPGETPGEAPEETPKEQEPSYT